MGPFELMDLTGIDVNFPARKIIYEGFFHDRRMTPSPYHESLYAAGRLGRKTGGGWYSYDATGAKVTLIKDSPGFIAQRMCAMIANLGCEMAMIGIASAADVDTAMTLGLNYPRGPLALADWLGVKDCHEILVQLQAITGDDRYRPSQWLRRRAQLGLSATTLE